MFNKRIQRNKYKGDHKIINISHSLSFDMTINVIIYTYKI